jgi:fluoride exporter
VAHRGSSLGFHVAAGGGAGALSRLALGRLVDAWTAASFPWGTLLINIVGSAALGFIYRALPPALAGPRTRAFLAIGFCGGFTSFSAFDLEMLLLLRETRFAAAALYAGISVMACMAAVYGGFSLAAATARRG